MKSPKFPVTLCAQIGDAEGLHSWAEMQVTGHSLVISIHSLLVGRSPVQGIRAGGQRPGQSREPPVKPSGRPGALSLS